MAEGAAVNIITAADVLLYAFVARLAVSRPGFAVSALLSVNRVVVWERDFLICELD
jgi:hypothetical protein